MANTKKVNSAEAEVVETNPAIEENEALKAKIAEQEQQMADLMAQIKVMMQAQAATNPVNIEEKAARGIKFISLVPGGLTLKGNRMYHIDKQFGYKMIEPTMLECKAPIIFRGVIIQENLYTFDASPVGYLQVFEV